MSAIRQVLICSILLFTGTATRAQTTTPIIDRNTLYILFLKEHSTARAELNKTPARVDYAGRLGLTSGDLLILDNIANAFSTADTRLYVEAKRYHTTTATNAQSVSHVHSFTVRREALAAQAEAALKQQLSSASYSSLDRYINTTFRQSISIVRNNHANPRLD